MHSDSDYYLYFVVLSTFSDNDERFSSCLPAPPTWRCCTSITSFTDTIMIFLASVDKISGRLHWFKSTCLPRCLCLGVDFVSVSPVRKIISTYPNTRSYVQRHQIPRPTRKIRTYHGTDDSNGVGNEVLGNVSMMKKIRCGYGHTSARPGQTRIRIETRTLTSHHEVGTSEVGKTGSANATPVWSG